MATTRDDYLTKLHSMPDSALQTEYAALYRDRCAVGGNLRPDIDRLIRYCFEEMVARSATHLARAARQQVVAERRAAAVEQERVLREGLPPMKKETA
jgi:hypothetical protein